MGAAKARMAAACLSSPPAACKSHLAQAGVSISREERRASLPQGDVSVHAAAVVLENRFGHERDRLAVTPRDVLADGTCTT